MAVTPNSVAAAASVVVSRPVITTRAPSATNRRAVARPIPLLPPVISAVLSISGTGFLGKIWSEASWSWNADGRWIRRGARPWSAPRLPLPIGEARDLQASFEDAVADVRRYVAMLAERGHAMGLELGDEAVDRVGADSVIGHPGLDAEAFEESFSPDDRRLDALVIRAIGDLPDAFGILQQLGALGFSPLAQQRGQDECQRRGPHQVGAQVIVFRVGDCLRTNLDQSLE